MKERILDEKHMASFDIYTREVDKQVELGEVPRAIFGLYIKSYQHSKSKFMKLRFKLIKIVPKFMAINMTQ